MEPLIILLVIQIWVILLYRPKEDSMYEGWRSDYGWRSLSKCGKRGSRMRHHRHRKF